MGRQDKMNSVYTNQENMPALKPWLSLAWSFVLLQGATEMSSSISSAW
jgi:hypothetical protein